jgi:VanZ family protein
MKSPLLSQPVAKVIFWLLFLAVILGAVMPQSTSPQLFALADKVVHTVAFLVLTLVGLRAYPRQVLVMVVVLIALGGLIEILQGYTSTRSQEWEDFLADILGVGLGTLLAKQLWPDKQR